MSTVAFTSFLPLLATTPLVGSFNPTAAREAVISIQDLTLLQVRLDEQRFGASSLFSDKVEQLAEALVSKKPGKEKRISKAKGQAAGAWNGLSPQLRLDAQIAAAQVVAQLTSPESMAAIAEEDHGVIGPTGEGAENFHDPQASIVGAVSATGPLGTVALLKLQRWVDAYVGRFDKTNVDWAAKEQQDARESLRAAQLFFLSALMLSPEWGDEASPKDWNVPSISSGRLISAVENLHRAGQRRPANQYLDDVIGLSRVAVQVAPKLLKNRDLAFLQEVLAEKLEPRAEEARPDSNQLIVSALYWLDAAANWNNAEETEAARRAFDKSVALLQLAGRLPAQAGS